MDIPVRLLKKVFHSLKTPKGSFTVLFTLFTFYFYPEFKNKNYELFKEKSRTQILQ